MIRLLRSIPRHFVFLAAILVLGAALRIIGSQWGLPGPSQIYAYYPDEHNILDALYGMNPHRFDFHPRADDTNPSLHYYLSGAVFAAGAAVGYIDLVKDKSFYYRDHPEQLTRFYKMGRWLILLLSTATITAFYFIGCLLFKDRKAGLWCALFLAVSPLHAVFSHFNELSVSATLWLSLAWIFLILPGKRWLPLAGFLAGLALATKYTSAAFVATFAAAVFFDPSASSPKWKRMAIAGGFGLAGFLTGCPYALLDVPWFAAQLRHAFLRAGGDTPSLGLFVMPLGHLGYGLGWSLAVLSFAGLFMGIVQRRRPAILCGFHTILYLFLTARSCLNISRYQNELLPFLLPWAVLPLQWLGDKFSRKTVTWGLVILACLPPLVSTLSYDAALLKPDPRDHASQWLLKNIPSGADIGVGRRPFFYTPPALYSDEKYGVKSPFNVCVLDCSVSRLAEEAPNYLVLSDFEYNPRLHLEPGAEDQEALFIAEVQKRYKATARFSKTPGLWGWPFPKKSYHGHDWLYPFAEITVYEKREPATQRGRYRLSWKEAGVISVARINPKRVSTEACSLRP